MEPLEVSAEGEIRGSDGQLTRRGADGSLRLWDVNQKSLYLQNNELIAGYLQAPNSAMEEKIFWVRNQAFDQDQRPTPIILSVRGGKSCLASSHGSPPDLHLESVNITDLCKDKVASARFTFFVSRKDGISRFESAAHPGWFLCTSSKANEPLGLVNNPGSSHLVDFYFQRES
ncbi:interleukin-1 receptor antagonist protein-like isoform X2 [Erythrolamprus reginae]|uniref:interleukin-1 receptor antagonist protein-like isoform X2 n=1 Tax=Erythrolamprus reginae TaxID=121349 RepID=UPI00396C7E46